MTLEYEVASIDDVENPVPEEYGGLWRFRDALGCRNFGITYVEFEPGGKGRPHDHAEEGEEEVYLVVDGELTVELGEDGEGGEETVTIGRGEALRVAPDTWRALSNRGEETVRLVAAGAP